MLAASARNPRAAMLRLVAPRPTYSRAEYLSDAAVHLGGSFLVLVAVPALIVLTAALHPQDVSALVGVSVYGAALAAMILCSAAYNLSQRATWGWLLRRLDHAAIYLKIAGTYTPFALISGQGLAVTAGVWAAAALGIGLKLVSPDRLRWLALGLWLGMGWAGALAGQALLAALPGEVTALMLGGGILYTLGVLFFLWERLPFHYTIWHLHVLLASALFYGAVLLLVLAGAGPA